MFLPIEAAAIRLNDFCGPYLYMCAYLQWNLDILVKILKKTKEYVESLEKKVGKGKIKLIILDFLGKIEDTKQL